MQPEPYVVVNAVDRLLSGPWPALEDRRDWLARHGLLPAEQVGSWQHWGQGVPGWGTTQVCWALDGNAFVGLGFFLWPGIGHEAVAAELGHLLTERYGEPTRRAAAGSTWWEWTIGETVLEFEPGNGGEGMQIHLVHEHHAECEVLGRRAEAVASPVEEPLGLPLTG